MERSTAATWVGRGVGPTAGLVGARPVDWAARLGAAGVLAAMVGFAVTVGTALGVSGAAYVWQTSMISDLGDGACHVRGGRWICSPGFAAFNAGLIGVGVVMAVASALLVGLWGRAVAGSLVVMGGGLVVAGVFPAGDDGLIHLVGVVLALVVPGLGLLLSAIRPPTPWLAEHRVKRGVLSAVALVLCAESRLPDVLVPRGAGELGIVACLLLGLAFEAGRVLACRCG